MDLAKNVFQVRGINEHSKVVLKKQLRRNQMAAFFVNLPPCLIAWGFAGRRTTGPQAGKNGPYGAVKGPQFVKPYAKTSRTMIRGPTALLTRTRGWTLDVESEVQQREADAPRVAVAGIDRGSSHVNPRDGADHRL